MLVSFMKALYIARCGMRYDASICTNVDAIASRVRLVVAERRSVTKSNCPNTPVCTTLKLTPCLLRNTRLVGLMVLTSTVLYVPWVRARVETMYVTPLSGQLSPVLQRSPLHGSLLRYRILAMI